MRDEMREKLRILHWPASSPNLMPKRLRSTNNSPSLLYDIHAPSEAAQQMDTELADRTQRGYAIERESQPNRERPSILLLRMRSLPRPPSHQ